MAIVHRKLWHLTAIIDNSILHDVMMLIEGKSFDVKFRPVKHAGVDEQTGAPVATPTGLQFCAAYASSHQSFTTADIIAAAEEMVGMRKQTVHAGLYALKANKIIKSTGRGEWQVIKSKAAAQQALPAPKPEKKKRNYTDRPLPAKPRKEIGTRVSDKIMAILKDGEVDLQTIKKELQKGGDNPTGASPVLTNLVNNKVILRVRPSVYKIAPPQHANGHA